MSNVDISYGELITIGEYNTGTGLAVAAQSALAYAIKYNNTSRSPLIAISADTFYFSNNLTVGGDVSANRVKSNVLDISGDTTIDGELDVSGDSYLRGNLEVNKTGILFSEGDRFRLSYIDLSSDASYALQQSGSGETTINSGNELYFNIRGQKVVKITDRNLRSDFDTLDSILDIKGDISLSGNFDISGNMYASGTLDVSGETTIDKTLTVTGDASFNSNVDISGTLDVSGDTTIDKTLTVTENASFNSNVDISGTLDVSGDTTMGGTLTVTGDASFNSNVDISGTLDVSGDTTIDKTLTVTGDASFNSNVDISGTLDVSGDTTIDKTLTVKENASFNSNVDISGTLDVSGDTTIDKTLTVTENASFNSNVDISGTLDVSGDTTMGGTLTVTGDASFNSNVDISGTLDVSGDTTIDKTLTVTGDASFNSNVDISGTLDVSGDTTIDKTLTVKENASFNSNVDISGTLDVSGDTTIDKTLTVTENASFNSNVDISGTLDVSGDTTMGGTLTVTGDASFNSNVDISGTLDVSGDTTIDKTLTVTGDASFNSNVDISGTLDVSGDTTIDKTLTVKENASFNSNVDISGTLDVSGDTTIDKTLTVTENASFNSNVDISGTLDVSGDTTMGGTLTVTGDASFNSNVDISGDVTIDGELTLTGYIIAGNTVSGDTDVSGTLDVSGDTTIDKTLTVTGKASFKSNVDISGNLDVSGDTTMGGTLTVTGDTSFNSNVDISGTLDVSGDTTMGGTLTVTGDTSFNSNVDISGNLDVSSNTTMGGTLTVTKDTSFNSNVDISGTLDVSGDTTIDKTLKVTGDTSFNSNVDVGRNLTVTGDVTIGDKLNAPAILYIDPAAIDDNTGTVVIMGNLQVDGSMTTINSTVVDISDRILVLASNSNGSEQSNNAGIDVSGGGSIKYYTYDDGVWKIDSNTYISGNTTIAGTLDVSGETVLDNSLNVTGDTTLRGDFYIKNGGTNKFKVNNTDGNVDIAGTLNVDDAVTLDTTLTVSGNVGIGTTSPSEKLDVSGGNIRISNLHSSTGLYESCNLTLYASNSSTTWHCGSITGYIAAGTGGDLTSRFPGGLLFKTKPQQPNKGTYVAQELENRMVIDANGDVGIGTTNPSEKLEVVGDISCQNLYANARIIKTNIKDCEYIDFNVADRIYYHQSGNWNTDTGDYVTTDTVKYIPLANLNASGSMNVKGILRDSDGLDSYVCKVDLMISARYYSNYGHVHVQGTLTGKLISDAALVLFSNTVNADGTTYDQSGTRYLLYFVTSVNFSHYDLNINGPGVTSVWPGPTRNGLDEHPMTDQLTSFPQNRGVNTDLGIGPHSLDINTPASGIRTMYTTNTLYDSGDGGAHIAVIHHATDDAGDNVITKFPVDVSCADLYGNKILTPSGNDTLYIAPNHTNTNGVHRIIHLGLTAHDENVGQLRFGRADPYGNNPSVRYHSIKVQSYHGGASNNYMRFDLHNGGDGANSDTGETHAEQVNVMTLRGDGNVGIGTTNPSKSLEVAGDISCQNLYANGNVDISGSLQVTNNANFYDEVSFTNIPTHGGYNLLSTDSLSNYSQSGSISLESTAGSVDISGVDRINLTAENGIWLKCMETIGSVGVVNFGRADGDLRYNTIENYNTSDTGEPYMSFKIHDGVNDSDDDSQVTPLKLFGSKLIQGTHMELVSDIYTDSSEVTPNLLIKALTNEHDVKLSLRGYRQGATTVKEAFISFENFDENYTGTTQTDKVGTLGQIAGFVTDYGNNVGDMIFYTSLNGVDMNECLRMNKNNTLTVSGNVGIGTTNPSKKLEVAGDISCQNLYANGDTTLVGDFYIKNGGTNKFKVNTNGNVDISGTLNVDEAVTLDNTLTVSGNVGIGVTDPSKKLEVAGDISCQNLYANLVLATSSVRGGMKIGYTQSDTKYPVQLSSEKAYVDINGFNSDLSSYSQSADISLESTSGNVTLKADTLAELRSVNSDSTLTKLYTEGTNGHIYGFTKDTQRLLISSNGRINLTAENGIWLKCMLGYGTTGVVNFGRKDNDIRYNTIENFNTNVAGEPYMAFKVHDGVDDDDDTSQVTPLKLFGDKLIQGTHMELVSNIYTDSGEATPNLMIKPNNNGNDVNLVLQGARNGATTVRQANITFENLDNNVGTGTQTNQVGIMGRISGKITDVSNNLGDLLFFSSSNGVATTECMRITRFNKLNLTGQLERPTDAYMTEVKSDIRPTSNQSIRGADEDAVEEFEIDFQSSFTTEGITHATNDHIFTNTNDGMTHLRLNLELGVDTMQTPARGFFACYVKTNSYSGQRQYFLGSTDARAADDSTTQFRMGGNIDLYLNKDSTFIIVVKKLFWTNISRDIKLSTSNSLLQIDKIH